MEEFAQMVLSSGSAIFSGLLIFFLTWNPLTLLIALPVGITLFIFTSPKGVTKTELDIYEQDFQERSKKTLGKLNAS